MTAREPRKFDPAKAAALDAPQREEYLPAQTVVGLLELSGHETVVDYGAGTGRLSGVVADALPHGLVLAVEESPEMMAHLRDAVARRPTVRPMLITHNRVPAPDATADRILAVNLLHEVRGENALAEMRRLLAPDGSLLIIDWERGRPRDIGPPDALLYTATDAEHELASLGFAVQRLTTSFPFHLTLRATHARDA